MNGKPDTHGSMWFAFEVAKEDFLWIFQRDDTPSRVISTLEALGVLAAWKLKNGEDPPKHRSRITVAPTVTDNRGNGAALKKRVTSKYPSSAPCGYLCPAGLFALPLQVRPFEESSRLVILLHYCHGQSGTTVVLPGRG